MKSSFRDLFFDPNMFFLDLISEKESLKIPALIILLGGITAAVYGFIVGGLTSRMMENLMPNMGLIITISAIAGALIGTFVLWILWGGLIHAISAGFKGKGTFNRTLQCIGYGYFPQIAGTLISLVLALDYLQKVQVPVISATSDPEVIQSAVKALMQDPAMRELTIISSVISILFLLWSANIWIFGIKNARQIPMRDAALSVGIPVVVYIMYILYSLWVV
jgi:hypothetical protein